MEIGNPILVKEMRTRMRGVRAFAIVTLYAAVIGVCLGLFYWGVVSSTSGPAISGLGVFMTAVLVMLQMGFICLISPTFTASAISSEREQETFELLVASMATPFSIMVGKIGASLCYLALVLLASLPMVAFLYWVGGMSLSDVSICYLVMFMAGTSYCCMSFLWSTLIRRGVLAQLVGMLGVVVLVVGLPGLALFVTALGQLASSSGNPSFWSTNAIFMLLRTSPFYAMGGALFGQASAPQTVWLAWVPPWVFQVFFSAVLSVLASLAAWRRLKNVRNWL